MGSVLYLTATVAYTDSAEGKGEGNGDDGGKTDEEGKYIRVQIRIDSRVRNIEHGETRPTGQFNYTFLIEKDVRIMPQTYSEFMIWIDARRRAERVRNTIDGLGGVDVDEGKDDGRENRVTE